MTHPLPTALKRSAVTAAGGIAALLGIGWTGLQIPPEPFPSYPVPAAGMERVPIPGDLPPPVERYLRLTLGDSLPLIHSAVLSARGRLRISGITFPARLRFTHAAGSAYRHDIEATWFGMPVLRVNERYIDGHARLHLPWGTIADEPKVDQGANLALWGEQAAWLLPVMFTDARVHWRPVDATTARLLVPSSTTDDEFTVTFDPDTGLVRQMQALRYRAATDSAKITWTIEPRAWQVFDGMRLPAGVALTWADEGTPWLVLTMEHAAYNVDVSASIRAAGS
jgi:hypothetical protein